MAQTPDTVFQEETIASDGGGREPPPREIRHLRVGDLVGRYVLLDRLGAGGMGVVFAAYDPELDRKVALKLLRQERRRGARSSAGHRRLLREAQAMARLAHPNVMTVHDVGEYEGSVFIAMEFVDGMTLGRVRVDKGRTWRDVVGIYLQAGQGLAAAHAADLIHRDFKPENVMLGKDGRVMVMDFGLARAVGAATDPQIVALDSAAVELEQTDSSELSARLTRTGQLIGTPAYMSPEQHSGLPADKAADQFAFCVSLYEALYGERPFAGRGRKELAESVTRGRVREPPKDSGVPGWVRKIVVRGLSVDPDMRWPSMVALLEALARDPTKVWKRAAAGVGAAVLLGGAIGGVAYARQQEALVCKGAEAQLAGVWDDQRRAQVRSAFERTGASYAASTLERVNALLDDYAGRWIEGHVDACEATNVRRSQSTEMLDVRMACLHRRLKSFGALVDVFAAADASVVEKAVEAAGSLDGVEPCADVDALTSAVPPPGDETTRDRVAELRGDLARAHALEIAGRYGEGLQVASAVSEVAASIGYRPLEAEALAELGFLHGRMGKHAEAERHLADAAWAARASGHDDVSAKATAFLVSTIGFRQARPEDAATWIRHAEADVQRIGATAAAQGRLLQQVALVRIREGKLDEAGNELRGAIGLLLREYGADDPRIAALHNNLGGVLQQSGDTEGARASYEQALAIRQRALGPDHPQVATTMSNLARLDAKAGRFADALEHQRRALDILVPALGAEHAHVTKVRIAAASALRGLDRDGEAQAELERVVEILERTMGADHPELASALTNLGEVMHEQGKFDDALGKLRRAQQIRDAKLKPEHRHHAYSLTGIGRALVELARAREALEPLERALAIREAGKGDPGRRGETRFALARALVAAGDDRGRAERLARAAAEDLRGAGPRWSAELQRCERWLDEVWSAHDQRGDSRGSRAARDRDAAGG